VRRLRTTTDLNAYLTVLPQLRQVAEVTRTVTHKGATHQEVVFLVTSRSAARATSAQLLAWTRGHWSIEARHHVRDVAFAEDRSQLRHGHAPHIMAACRNLCITLLHRTGRTDISAGRRSFAYHPGRALALLNPNSRRA
jgi:hypothetical protein